MSSLPASAEDVIGQPVRDQFEVFIDEHRSDLNACLDGLTEEQARRSLVPSRTTLLGLVKHATFVEKVWFDEAVTCRSRGEIGIAGFLSAAKRREEVTGKVRPSSNCCVTPPSAPGTARRSVLRGRRGIWRGSCRAGVRRRSGNAR
jgi:hypothetical protein